MAEDVFAFLEERPPRCLDAFGAILRDKTVNGHLRSAQFDVSCKACGSGLFSMNTLTRTWKDSEERSEIGIVVNCSGCNDRRVLFDATKFGYDGEHHHFDFMNGSDSEKRFDRWLRKSRRVRLEFVYNNEFADLTADAEKTGRSPQDFFDWIHVMRAREGSESWSYDWEFECA